MDKTKVQVSQYYSETLQNSGDLKTSACCDVSIIPDWLQTALTNIHPEVSEKYYGCGLIAPEKLKDAKILDLGSGSGRDCYLLSQLVGENGLVIGVDMTDSQLAVANKHLKYHQEKFGYAKSNVEFKKGQIEHLDLLNLETDFFDIVISNCVINLSTDKNAVLKEVKRVLKPGGEMYFSDVYTNKRVPADLVKDPVLYGECLSGALYWNDFLNLSQQIGFSDPRLVEDKIIDITNNEIAMKTQGIEFYSATYRLFNIDELEPQCEDYGQAVKYLGGIDNHENEFNLDNHHPFIKNKINLVCGNTFLMLKNSRFKNNFEFYGDFKNHYGIFPDCGTQIPFKSLTDINTNTTEGCC